MICSVFDVVVGRLLYKSASERKCIVNTTRAGEGASAADLTTGYRAAGGLDTPLKSAVPDTIQQIQQQEQILFSRIPDPHPTASTTMSQPASTVSSENLDTESVGPPPCFPSKTLL